MSFKVVCIVKDEEDYVQEFIEYYLYHGASNIYIYDNSSSDYTPHILKKYTALGFIESCVWPESPGQISAYNNYIFNHANDQTFTAFIDIDEFIQPLEHETLKDFFEEFEPEVSGIGINWRLWGSSGIHTYNRNLVILRFTQREESLNKHIKSVIRPCRVLTPVLSPHCFNLFGDFVDTFGNNIKNNHPFNETNECRAVINHYHTKSKYEYELKCKKGRADTGEIRDFESSFLAHDKNEIEDLSMSKYAPSIIKRINAVWTL